MDRMYDSLKAKSAGTTPEQGKLVYLQLNGYFLPLPSISLFSIVGMQMAQTFINLDISRVNIYATAEDIMRGQILGLIH